MNGIHNQHCRYLDRPILLDDVKENEMREHLKIIILALISVLTIVGCTGHIAVIQKNTPVKVEYGVIDHSLCLGTNDGTSIKY